MSWRTALLLPTALVAACSLLYNPNNLDDRVNPGDRPDASAGDPDAGGADPAEPDAGFDADPGVDAALADAADAADGSVPDARMIDAALPLDAPPPDAAVPPDAAPPDAGSTCGGVLEPCCDTAPRCTLGLCLGNTCIL